MAGRIPKSFIDELVARADIVEVVGARVTLKRAGSNYKGLCPFHGEKTPSFTVSPSKGFYHCFGCSAHGTAIGFLMAHDNLEFPEAVEALAEMMGLEVPRENTGQPERKDDNDELYSLLREADQVYRAALRTSETAIAYLKKRGIDASLHHDAGLSTTQKLRVIGRRQQLLRIDFEKPPSREVLASKLEDFRRALPESDVIILSDYGKGGLHHIAEMIRSARRAGKRVLVDPKGDDYARYRGASIITPNLAELREVVGTWKDEKDLKSRAQALLEKLGLEALLLTRGEHGMTLFRKSKAFSVPAEKREVLDVTGAGDTVIATLAVMLAAGATLEAAVRLANRAAGIVVGKLGTAAASHGELFPKK